MSPIFCLREKTHVVSLGKIALGVGYSTVCTIVTSHTNDVTKKYSMKKAHY